MRTALAAPDPHEEGARKALLERLATYMQIMADTDGTKYSCCWLAYTGPRGQKWLWRMCDGEMPGHLGSNRCDHWHHGHEIFLAQ